MQMIISLWLSNHYINQPNDLIGWAGFAGLLALLLAGMIQWKSVLRENTRRDALIIFLIVATPLTALFLGVRFPTGSLYSISSVFLVPSSPAVMLLCMAPWMLAAGLIGMIPAMAIAAITGTLLAVFDSHSYFSIIQMLGLALLFGLFNRQNYRGKFFDFLRHPGGAALSLVLLFAPIYILTTFFTTSGAIAARLDAGLTQSWALMLASGAELLVAGICAEVVYAKQGKFWYAPKSLEPSPIETSLSNQFLLATSPFLMVLVIVLLISGWVNAGNAARQMIDDRLSNTSDTVANSLPYFIQAGRSLIQAQTTTALLASDGEQRQSAMAQALQSVPYFRQLNVFDARGNFVDGFPNGDLDLDQMSNAERNGIQIALAENAAPYLTLPSTVSGNPAQVAFMAPILDKSGKVQGVLEGRTDLSSNLFTRPVVETLQAIANSQGEAYVLDDKNQVLFHSQLTDEIALFGSLPSRAGDFATVAPDGMRYLGYYETALGSNWKVVVVIPDSYAQQQALNFALPLLITICVFTLAVAASIQFGMRRVTRTLKRLSSDAAKIARGQLEFSIPVRGSDEVGLLGSSFEQMRTSLKTRLEELNQLLLVSQNVAANFRLDDSIKPIMTAALSTGASCVRLVLAKNALPDDKTFGSVAYKDGKDADHYAYLDSQLFDLMRQQDLLVISNPNRMKHFNLNVGKMVPGALLARALNYKDAYYGVLWTAYEQPRSFSDEEMRFLGALAVQAATAASNASLYGSAEIGRERLAAVIASTPMPVLVIDETSRLLLINPAAAAIPGLAKSFQPGQDVAEVVGSKELLALLQSPVEHGNVSREIVLQSGQVFQADVSQVLLEGKSAGKVCILSDVTQNKRLDTLKTDLIETASHDLRSPLTLVHGYASMMQMAGELNEQQKGYVNKIVGNVEEMNRLVLNLLDLRRIESGTGLQLDSVEPGAIVNQVMEELEMQATQKNLKTEFTNELAADTTVMADAVLLHQAVFNLVENAIKFSQLGGKIQLRLSRKPESITLQVADGGIGIAPLDLPHIFEKFYRSGKREDPQPRGSGLGLAIVKSIVERHHGKAWVESQLGKGSTFYLELPLDRPMGRG
ncbi:MAG TPA: ATP-binding protein [Longilinea sp.]|nr:ATP-binding protein [Longilinea sp.]